MKNQKRLSLDADAINIRPATTEDSTGIAKVHVDTWRTTYAGIIPEGHFNGLSYESRQQMFQEKLLNPKPRWHLLVAVDSANQVVGFVGGGVNRSHKDYPFAGEIYAIYLRQHLQGQGIGGRLFSAASQRLSQDGFHSMMLWVLEANPACHFYQRMGGSKIGHKLETIGGTTLPEVAYGWPSIVAFMSHILDMN